MVTKIISGGQTGVDRAALDAAIECGVSIGGWCPRGRRAEDGPIGDRYPLSETPDAGYDQRTHWNVRDSDGTLVLLMDTPAAGGTAETLEACRRFAKPCLEVVLPTVPDMVCSWLRREGIQVLNVAGPRESEAADAYDIALQFMRGVLQVPSR